MSIKSEKFFVDGKETKERSFLYHETDDGKSFSCYYDWLDCCIGLAFEPLEEYAEQLVTLLYAEKVAAGSVGVIVEALTVKAKKDLEKWEKDLRSQIGRPGVKRISYGNELTISDPSPMHPVGASFIQYADEKEATDAN